MSQIDKLLAATKKMNDELDVISKEVAYLEDSLQEAGLRIFFEMKIDACTFFRWQADPESKKGKRWRLFIFDTESDTSVPLRQTKSEIRIKYCAFLHDFLEAFTKKVNEFSARYSQVNEKREKVITKEKITEQLSKTKKIDDDETLFEKINMEYVDDLPY